MRQSKYRLQPVVDVRERAKQEASRVVATRRAQLAEAEAELARREREVARCRAEQRDAQARMFDEARSGAEARRMIAHRTHLADLRCREEELLAAAARQREVAGRAATELDNALAHLVEASKEFQVIERHRQHWRDEQRRDAERREQKANDEAGAIIHRRNAAE